MKLLALIDQDEQNPNALTFDVDQAQVPQGDLFYVEDSNGARLAGSSAWIGDLSSARHTGNVWNLRRSGRDYRAAADWNVPILDQEDPRLPRLRATLFYALPMAETEAKFAHAARMAGLAGVFALMMSAVLTWWAVGRGMQPLTEFARRADLIRAERAEFEAPSNLLNNAELVPLSRALSSLAARVREAFQRERRFLGDAAHELKTAIAIQKSTLQLLEQGAPTNLEYREGLARALDDTSRIELLVRDMLLLSSMEHARQAGTEIANSSHQLNHSLLAALDQLAPFARVRSVTCRFEPPADAWVAGSEADLTLLWTNLIENAIQYSPVGATVLIEAEDHESTCRVRIVDSGSGISCIDLPHVFERFYRSDASRARSTGGFGLGLSIAKAVAEKLGGTIQLWSTPGTGTTAELTLPKSPEASSGAVEMEDSGNDVRGKSPS